MGVARLDVVSRGGGAGAGMIALSGFDLSRRFGRYPLLAICVYGIRLRGGLVDKRSYEKLGILGGALDALQSHF